MRQILALIPLLVVVTADVPIPHQVLGLSRWKLGIPVDDQGDGVADEILAAELRTYRNPDFFFVNEDSAVVFRARCDAPTTPSSHFPRCELRELEPDGSRAAWSTAGRALRVMEMTVAITHTPAVKKHVVCAQIHGGDDDVLKIRLEDRTLFIERDGHVDCVLDPDYSLGKVFAIRMEAGGGRVRVWHDGRLALDWPIERAGCFYKAGCYTQSNTHEGDAADDFGETRITRLVLESFRLERRRGQRSAPRRSVRADR